MGKVRDNEKFVPYIEGLSGEALIMIDGEPINEGHWWPTVENDDKIRTFFYRKDIFYDFIDSLTEEDRLNFDMDRFEDLYFYDFLTRELQKPEYTDQGKKELTDQMLKKLFKEWTDILFKK